MLRNKGEIKILTRASALARRQTEAVLRLLPQDLAVDVVALKSWGDKHKQASLLDNPAADIFTRELDQALLRGRGDMAVHSAKDLPYPLPEGLEVIALLAAADQSDCLVSKARLQLRQLPAGAKVGTSSLLRQAQVRALRPDLEPVDIRGTIEERLAKIAQGEVEAVIVATCALKRLGRDAEIAEILPFQTHPLQGHLAVVARDDREDLKQLFAANHQNDDSGDWGRKPPTRIGREAGALAPAPGKPAVSLEASAYDVRRTYGTVYLVGFGPGDPELLTLKAARLLARADVIVHDELLNTDALNAYAGEKIDVGKRKGRQKYTQTEIQELLHARAKAGQTVVRLKGGDPFIFGRGGEELDYLKARLISVEIVPGISSALGAAAYAEIPLTKRGISSSVAFCTGHSKEKITVPQADTLVYYMAADTLPSVARAILAHGWNPHTPVACVTRATWPGQEVYFANLAALKTKMPRLASPLLVIVGQVAAQGRKRNWFAKRKKILFTGTHPEHFQHLGEVVHHPLIEIKALKDYRAADACIKQMSRFHWLVFTSQHTVQHFFKRLQVLNLDSRALHRVRIASVGKQTTRALGEQGLIADLQAPVETARGLVEAFAQAGVKNARVLLPHSNLASRTLARGLTALGHQVTPLVVYQTVARKDKRAVDWDGIQEVFFASPSGVRIFKQRVGRLPAHVHSVAIGPETERALRHAKI